MAKITVVDGPSFEADENTRLIKAIEGAGVDILHRCGGYAGCTTCRVEFVEGEPTSITQAELTKLTDGENLEKFRLSCQILCSHDMTVKPLFRLSEMENMDDAGPEPKDQITPDPEWTERPY